MPWHPQTTGFECVEGTRSELCSERKLCVGFVQRAAVGATLWACSGDSFKTHYLQPWTFIHCSRLTMRTICLPLLLFIATAATVSAQGKTAAISHIMFLCWRQLLLFFFSHSTCVFVLFKVGQAAAACDCQILRSREISLTVTINNISRRVKYTQWCKCSVLCLHVCFVCFWFLSIERSIWRVCSFHHQIQNSQK